MATTNLALESIDPSDYVSPDTINNNFAKVDSLGVDYVVEAGYSGEWWYRKWKSGRAECGIDDKRFDNWDRTSPWGSLYRTAEARSFGAYPFAFMVRPHAMVVQHSIDGGTLGGYIFYNSSDSTTTSPIFMSVDSVPYTLGHPHLGIYVVGRYK
jgi:hypothetical protein